MMLAGALARLVSEKFTVVSPAAVAVTVYGPPAIPFAVNGAAATPEAFVGIPIVTVLLLNNPEGPDPGAVNVTLTPATGLPPLSLTVTAGAFEKGVLITALCGVVPTFAVIVAGAPARLVNEKFAEVAPVALATTLYGPPAVAFAVNVVEVATPLVFVVAIVDAVPFANVPLAPLAGAVKVTVTPLTGLFRESLNVAWRGVANAVLMPALCGVPPVAVMLDVVPPVPMKRLRIFVVVRWMRTSTVDTLPSG